MLSEEIDIERLTAEDVLTEEQRFYLGKRVALLARCELYEDVRAAVIRACTIGVEATADTPAMPSYLFFFRYLANIFEPRNPSGMQLLPFVPYDYQVEGLALTHKLIQLGLGVTGQKNIVLDRKSRDMGDTWEKVGYFGWDFLFNKGSYHMGSFKEEEVDILGTHTTLFGKLRKMFYSLPKWLLPADFVDKSMLLSHSSGEVTITGESANSGFGRSKRVKAALMDEFQKWEHDYAALQAVSGTCNTIFLIGTPEGYGNYYSEIARKKKIPGAIVRTIHWTQHPLKMKGAELVGGKWTSPWYRDQCAKLPPEVVAAELDLSFESSVKGPVFAHVYGVSHQKKGLKLLPGLPIIRAWDPGGGHFAVVLMQVTRDRRVIIYREVLMVSSTLDEAAAEVHRVSEELCRESLPKGYIGEWNDWFQFVDVGDPSGATISKANQLVPEYDDLYTKHGILVDYMQFATMPTEIRVRARILQIQNSMQKHIPSQNLEMDGPAFWIDVDGAPTLDEAFRGGYRRKLDANKNVTDAIEKRHPYNDVVDACGYGVVHALGVPEQIKREVKKRSEEQEEDEDQEDGPSPRRRSRC